VLLTPRIARAAALALALLAPLGCGGGGGLRSAVDVGSGADRARVHAARDALARELGHPVEVEVDGVLTEGSRGPLVVSQILEQLAGEVASAEGSGPAGAVDLARAVGVRGMWSAVRRIELRYSTAKAPPAFATDRGTLALFFDPDRFSASIDTDAVGAGVFRALLDPRFRGRPAESIAGPDLPAFVFFHTRLEPDATVSAHALLRVYPRLADPALSVARARLASVDLSPDLGAERTGLAELEAAWTPWFRTYASTLPDPELHTATERVFRRGRELPGLPAFEYGFGQALTIHRRAPTRESSQVACFSEEGPLCHGPFWSWLGENDQPERRQKLAAALLALHDPTFADLALFRLWDQGGDAPSTKRELLGLLAPDPEVWSGALRAALYTMGGEVAREGWATPALRPVILRTIDEVVSAPDRRRQIWRASSFNDTGEGQSVKLLRALTPPCSAPDLAAFNASLLKQFPPNHRVWRSYQTRGKC
jgi:hypothetical protein